MKNNYISLKNKKIKILITGANGFVGKELVKKILKKKKYSLSIILRNKKKSEFPLFRDKNIEITYGSLDDQKFLKNFFKKKKIDTIIHCAWQGVSSEQRNKSIQNNNLRITKNIIDSLKDISSVKTFISYGSQAEYGNQKKILKETSDTKPITKYGILKIKIYKKFQKFFEKKKIRFIWLRIFTGYGTESNIAWLIPKTIINVLNNVKMKFTKGEQIYNFVYISDIADATMKILKNKKAYGIYNLGGKKNYKIKKVISLIYKKMNTQYKPMFGQLSYRSDQTMNYRASISKIKKEVSWEPKVSLPMGIKKIIHFHKLKQKIF